MRYFQSPESQVVKDLSWGGQLDALKRRAVHPTARRDSVDMVPVDPSYRPPPDGVDAPEPWDPSQD